MTVVMFGLFHNPIHRLQGIGIRCVCENISIVTIKADSDIVLLKELAVRFVGGGTYQPIYADPPGILIAAAHQLASEDWCKDRINTVIEKHRAQFDMVLDNRIHVGVEKVTPYFFGVFEHKPASRPIDREYAELRSCRSDKVGNLPGGEVQEMLKGNHWILGMGGWSRCVL